ncbi:MAG: bifunctional DNA primase/polymerase [Candidatus Sulfotelmatobacter sp.]
MTFLDIALEHAARGWHVFPCKGKKPLTLHGFKDASIDPEQIRAWWTKWPDANVAIACGASGIAVFDIDHGLENAEGFAHLSAAMDLPETYAVRTGRRDDYGVQVYFSGVVDDVGDFRVHGCNGQIKSSGGYVMALVRYIL